MTARFDYSGPLATADRLIDRFGQDGLIRRETPGVGPAYDPGEPTTTDYPAVFAVTAYDNRLIDGSTILATDKRVLMSASVEIEPRAGDLLVQSNGEILSIVDADPLKPAETVLMWTLQARSA